MDDDDVEAELEAKLGDWRRSEGHKVAREIEGDRGKRERKARRKRKCSKLNSDIETGVCVGAGADAGGEYAGGESTEMKEGAKTSAELLSATLLRPRTDAKWSEPVHVGVAKAGIRKRTNGKRTKSTGSKDEYTDAAQLVERHRYEVGALGAAGLRKRDKRAYDEATLKQLGFRDARRPKMPLTILEGRRRAEKERKIQEREKKREEGVLLKSKRKGR